MRYLFFICMACFGFSKLWAQASFDLEELIKRQLNVYEDSILKGYSIDKYGYYTVYIVDYKEEEEEFSFSLSYILNRSDYCSFRPRYSLVWRGQTVLIRVRKNFRLGLNPIEPIDTALIKAKFLKNNYFTYEPMNAIVIYNKGVISAGYMRFIENEFEAFRAYDFDSDCEMKILNIENKREMLEPLPEIRNEQ